MTPLTTEEIYEAVEVLAASIKGFPQNDIAKAVTVKAIKKYVAYKEQLEWLIETACERMLWWSLPELRGIYCSRFKPADGVEGVAIDTPGFTPADLEAKYPHVDRKQLAAYQKAAERLPLAEPMALPESQPWPDAGKEKARLEAAAEPRISDAELKAAAERAPKRSEEENARLLAELQARLAALNKPPDDPHT